MLSGVSVWFECTSVAKMFSSLSSMAMMSSLS